ncbi:MAG: UDP-N-acetylmuramoyl-tripeptide--D-alanyl-D-alanine ligase [Coriobacteriales bacterium]|nr:UDP-N-acetylmuramoyl-tripeptide--D-alanyl-D-alanine ligase [Coriobacteriales bacterium]
MIRMAVADVVEATGATLVAGDASTTFEGMEIDSRLIGKGMAFVAFKGERVDGNAFAASALEAGAALVVLTDEPGDAVLAAARKAGAAVLRAAQDDGEEFLLRAAAAWRRANPQWVVVGVTGSVGKTTTKEMLAAAIGATKHAYATRGNFNSLLGVPLTLMRAPQDAEVLVVEMGMNHAGELERIAACVQPAVAVITNVGTSHIGNLGSREAIARAKAEVVGGLQGANGLRPTLVLSAGDDYCEFIANEFAQPAGVDVMRVGLAGESCVWAEDVTLDEQGMPSFVLACQDGKRLDARLALPGWAMVLDALSALGVVCALGLDVRVALDAVEAMRPTSMRLEVCKGEGTPRVINDSYNASPSSMAAALDVLCSMSCEGRRVAVIGQIGELGDESQRLHELVGAYVAAKDVDLLVLVGDEGARAMRDGACTMGYSQDRVEVFPTALDAARTIAPILEENDVVLVKASRAVGLELFAQEVLGSC